MSATKRFYKDVTTGPLTENGFGVFLDGRPLKTPGKKPLITHSNHVAALIAEEWASQNDQIKPETMPVTRLVNVSIELTPDNRDRLATEARNYAGTDLLCYRASEPAPLREQQAQAWDPILEWAGGRGINLTTTQSVLAIQQDDNALNQVQKFALELDDLTMTLYVHLTAVFGSAILAMAVLEKRLSGSQAFDLSRVDNNYQIDQWGEDEEAAEIAANLKAEVIALCKIMEA